MTRKNEATEILSICGQIEAVAAEIMIEKGKARKIERKHFPDSAPTHDSRGVPAAFAIVISKKDRGELAELIADLRA